MPGNYCLWHNRPGVKSLSQPMGGVLTIIKSYVSPSFPLDNLLYKTLRSKSSTIFSVPAAHLLSGNSLGFHRVGPVSLLCYLISKASLLVHATEALRSVSALDNSFIQNF